MIGTRVLLRARVEVGVEKTFKIRLRDENGFVIENLASFTLSGTFLKPDGSTEVSITPSLVASTSGPVPFLVACTLTAANNTAPAAADVGKPWLLNVYAAAPSGNAQPIDRGFVFYVRSEWE